MSDNAGIFDNNKVKIFLGIFAVIGIILLLAKVFGKGEDDRNREAANRSRRNTGKPTYPEYELLDAADILYRALAVGATEDEEVVYTVFSHLNNEADVQEVIRLYGTHRIASEIGASSLPETIGILFSPSEKSKLNIMLSRKGIQYQFK